MPRTTTNSTWTSCPFDPLTGLPIGDGTNAVPSATFITNPNVTVNDSPALGVANNQLWVAFAGRTDHNALFDGTITMSPPVAPNTVGLLSLGNVNMLLQANGQPQTTGHSPALASIGQVPVIAWIATNGDNSLEIMPLGGDGKSDTVDQISSGYDANGGDALDPLNGGPALDNNDGNLWLAWTYPAPRNSHNAPVIDTLVGFGFDVNGVAELASLPADSYTIEANKGNANEVQVYQGGQLVQSYVTTPGADRSPEYRRQHPDPQLRERQFSGQCEPAFRRRHGPQWHLDPRKRRL